MRQHAGPRGKKNESERAREREKEKKVEKQEENINRLTHSTKDIRLSMNE